MVKVFELKISFGPDQAYTITSTTQTKAELYAYAVEKYAKELDQVETIAVEELKNADIVLSSRAKKTHSIDDSGLKTICGESIDYNKAYLQGTRFRCEKCGN